MKQEDLIYRAVDVSAYQGQIDWSLVKGAGFNRAIIRSTTRNGKVDDYYYENVVGCAQNGIEIHRYKFMYALSFWDAYKEMREAIYQCKAVAPGCADAFIWIDVESFDGHIHTARELLEVIQGASAACAEWGVDCGIYCNRRYLTGYMPHAFEKEKMGAPIWLARYNTEMGDYPQWDVRMWQFTDKGEVPGIKGDVDISYYR